MNQPLPTAGRRRAGILDALQGGLRQPMPPSISIRNAMFTLVDAAGNEIPIQLFDAPYGRYLDIVIIGVNPKKSREYYSGPYDPAVPAAPVCFSDNGIAPSASAEVPQHPTCDMCPQAAWGSKISAKTQKGVPACSTKKKLAALVCNDPATLAYQFKIPPASLKNITELAQMLAKHQMPDEENPGRMRSADPADVVTRVYFDPANQGELLFQPIGYHSQMYPYIMQLIEHIDSTGSIDVLTGVNDVPYTGAIALPNPAPMAALPAPTMQTQAPPPPPAQQPIPQAFQQPAQQVQQPAPFQQHPLPVHPQSQPAPAPRPRRGGARAGAGRPAGQEAPQQAPQLMAAPQAAPFGAPTAQPGAPAPQPGAPAFGMTNGAQPDPALSQALQSAFAPMQPRQR